MNDNIIIGPIALDYDASHDCPVLLHASWTLLKASEALELLQWLYERRDDLLKIAHAEPTRITEIDEEQPEWIAVGDEQGYASSPELLALMAPEAPDMLQSLIGRKVVVKSLADSLQDCSIIGIETNERLRVVDWLGVEWIVNKGDIEFV